MLHQAKENITYSGSPCHADFKGTRALPEKKLATVVYYLYSSN